MAETRDSLLTAAKRLQELGWQPPRGHDEAWITEIHILAVRLRPVHHAATGSIRVLNTNTPGWLGPAKEMARQCVGFLEAGMSAAATLPPAGGGRLGPSAAVAHVEQVVAIARKSGEREDWARVAREATVFLEGELRLRSGTKAKGRKEVALDALKPGAARPIGSEEAEQQAWQQLTTGLLARPGNDAVHHPGERTQPYAMGVVGTVSLILAALDEQHGSSMMRPS